VLAPFIKPFLKLAPLLDAQNIASIGEDLGDAAGGGIDVGHLLRPERLEGGAVNGRRGEQVADSPPRGFDLFTQRDEVLTMVRSFSVCSLVASTSMARWRTMRSACSSALAGSKSWPPMKCIGIPCPSLYWLMALVATAPVRAAAKATVGSISQLLPLLACCG
jgi:hypothetical protein